MYGLFSEILKGLMLLEVQQRWKTSKNGIIPMSMATPKLLRPIPKSIVHFKNQFMVHYNILLLNKLNHKVVLRLQENNRNPWFPLEEVVWNVSAKYGPVKSYVHSVDDNITREASAKSEQIIVNR